MCCARADFSTRRRGGFTLLEVVLAVMILGMIAFSIYRFIEVTLTAIRVSTAQGGEEAAMQGLVAAIGAQLNDLPVARSNALRGEAHKFNNREGDEMTWVCHAGNGLFTAFAEGDYDVTLALKPVPKTTTSELGLRRAVTDANDLSKANWLPLMPGVDALEIRYFDPRLNAWLEKWSDAGARPALVRLRITRAGAAAPHETILALPATRLPQ